MTEKSLADEGHRPTLKEIAESGDTEGVQPASEVQGDVGAEAGAEKEEEAARPPLEKAKSLVKSHPFYLAALCTELAMHPEL